MKFKYLGTAAAEGVPAIFCDCENCRRSRKLGGKNIRTRSQAIINNELLIDFPADTYMHYLRYNFPLERIKSCLITHSHSDHLYPADIQMRQKGFANISGEREPITFYADEAAYDAINAATTKYGISELDVKCERMPLYEEKEIEGYVVSAVRAVHDPSSSPVLYIIEKDGKGVFYSHDTCEYTDEAYEYLKKRNKPLNFISLDCDDGCLDNIGNSHMTLWQCIDVKKRFLNDGIADKNTIFVLNHFSHNAKNVVYNDFSKIAAEYGFLTSYDGMEFEF